MLSGVYSPMMAQMRIKKAQPEPSASRSKLDSSELGTQGFVRNLLFDQHRGAVRNLRALSRFKGAQRGRLHPRICSSKGAAAEKQRA